MRAATRWELLEKAIMGRVGVRKKKQGISSLGENCVSTRISGDRRSLHYAPVDFLLSIVALMKGVVVASSAK